MLSVHFLDLELAKNNTSSNSDEVEKLKQKLEQEKIFKKQAISKLEEIAQRKGLTPGTKKNSKDTNTVKRKDYKKLEFELQAVCYLNSY